jgi:hypothetical protein
MCYRVLHDDDDDNCCNKYHPLKPHWWKCSSSSSSRYRYNYNTNGQRSFHAAGAAAATRLFRNVCRCGRWGKGCDAAAQKLLPQAKCTIAGSPPACWMERDGDFFVTYVHTGGHRTRKDGVPIIPMIALTPRQSIAAEIEFFARCKLPKCEKTSSEVCSSWVEGVK